MIFGKNKFKEDGYLLLDSLLTLTILMAIVTLIYPLIINWMMIHHEAKKLVEESREEYEHSMELKKSVILESKEKKVDLKAKNQESIRIKEIEVMLDEEISKE